MERPNPVTGKVIVDAAGSSVRLTADLGGPVSGKLMLVLVNDLPGSGGLIRFQELPVPTAAGRIDTTLSGLTAKKSQYHLPTWGSLPTLPWPVDDRPRALIIHVDDETDEVASTLQPTSDDIRFERELPDGVQHRERRHSRIVERNGKTFRSFRRQLSIYEVPLEYSEQP